MTILSLRRERPRATIRAWGRAGRRCRRLARAPRRHPDRFGRGHVVAWVPWPGKPKVHFWEGCPDPVWCYEENGAVGVALEVVCIFFTQELGDLGGHGSEAVARGGGVIGQGRVGGGR